MARLPRFDIPGIAQHTVQRGVDRQACFARDDDYLGYRQALGEAALRFGCQLHAYVLMTNHVHLLATPIEAGAVSRMMQAIGRRYVGGFNARYGRTGTLWEGRFKAALVESERHVLACHCYIELNPVRAGMVHAAGDYRWSSYGSNAEGRIEAYLHPHAEYLRLGPDLHSRRAAYRALFAEAIGPADTDALRRHTQQQRVWASDRFRLQIEHLTSRAVGVRTRGRPRRNALDK
jgi:putative transposase